MNTKELIAKAVAAGITEIYGIDHYPQWKKDACYSGFHRCNTLSTLEEFQTALREEEAKTEKLRTETKGGDRQAYQIQRWYTLQIEHCYGLLCFAWARNKLPGWEALPREHTRSARKGLLYARLVGVKGQFTA